MGFPVIKVAGDRATPYVTSQTKLSRCKDTASGSLFMTYRGVKVKTKQHRSNSEVLPAAGGASREGGNEEMRRVPHGYGGLLRPYLYAVEPFSRPSGKVDFALTMLSRMRQQQGQREEYREGTGDPSGHNGGRGRHARPSRQATPRT